MNQQRLNSNNYRTQAAMDGSGKHGAMMGVPVQNMDGFNLVPEKRSNT